MTPTIKKIIGAIMAGVATTIAALGAGEAGLIDPKVAATILAVINAILTGGMFVPTKAKP